MAYEDVKDIAEKYWRDENKKTIENYLCSSEYKAKKRKFLEDAKDYKREEERKRYWDGVENRCNARDEKEKNSLETAAKMVHSMFWVRCRAKEIQPSREMFLKYIKKYNCDYGKHEHKWVVKKILEQHFGDVYEYDYELCRYVRKK